MTGNAVVDKHECGKCGGRFESIESFVEHKRLECHEEKRHSASAADTSPTQCAVKLGGNGCDTEFVDGSSAAGTHKNDDIVGIHAAQVMQLRLMRLSSMLDGATKSVTCSPPNGDADESHRRTTSVNSSDVQVEDMIEKGQLTPTSLQCSPTSPHVGGSAAPIHSSSPLPHSIRILPSTISNDDVTVLKERRWSGGGGGRSQLPVAISPQNDKDEQPLDLSTRSLVRTMATAPTMGVDDTADAQWRLAAGCSAFGDECTTIQRQFETSPHNNVGIDYPSTYPVDHIQQIVIPDADNEEDWEKYMEQIESDEQAKIRQIVGDKPQPPMTDPNQCLICRRILSCKSALQMHYRCKLCQRAFTTKGNLKTHMGVHKSKHALHGQSSHVTHQCPICHKKFFSIILLQQHKAQHTNQLMHGVLRKGAIDSITNVDGLELHLHSRDQPVHLATNNTIVGQPTSTGATTADKQHHQLMNHNYHGNVNATLVQHPSKSSSYPSKKVNTNNSIDNDGNAAVDTGRHQQQQQADSNGLASTVQHTMCNICNKTFACHSALHIHYRSHTKERPFKCSICRRGFTTKGNMKQHLLTHKVRENSGDEAPMSLSGESETNSEGQASSSSNNNKDWSEWAETDRNDTSSQEHPPASPSSPDRGDHKLELNNNNINNNNAQQEEQEEPSLTMNPPESMELLAKTSTQQPPVAQHGGEASLEPSPLDAMQKMWARHEVPSRRHSPILSKHQCSVCYKHFSSSSALQIHNRTHTGDKPFICLVCTRAFTTKGNLKVHMGTHVWQNPHRRGRRIFDFSSNNNNINNNNNGNNNSHNNEGGSLTKKTLSSVVNSEQSNGGDRHTVNSPNVGGHVAQQQQSLDTQLFAGHRPSSYANQLLTCQQQLLPPHVNGIQRLLPTTVTPTSPYGNGPTAFGGVGLPSPPQFIFTADHRQQQPAPLLTVASMEQMLQMWRSVCSVCHKVCQSTVDLENHLKIHLNKGPSNAPSVNHVAPHLQAVPTLFANHFQYPSAGQRLSHTQLLS